MIPDSFGAVVAFFLLAAPGVLWVKLASRRRAQAKQTALEEAGFVVLASTVFTVVSSFVTAAFLACIMPKTFDHAWAAFSGRSGGVIVPWWPLLTSVIAVALLLVVIADQVVGDSLFGKAGSVMPYSLWVTLFRERAGESEPVATVTLSDQSKVRGHVAYWSVNEEMADRELGLDAPISRCPKPGGGWSLVGEQYLLLSATAIEQIEVTYVSREALSLARKRAAGES
jgi:hypothetical protein